jgi:(4S)-4-hydroxy-5-phosphonooxypentane-2,3-dione isomerase
MYVVCVHVHVKAEQCQAFIEATLENARNTRREPGNLRFDVIQQVDDCDRFVLLEVYDDEAAMKAHKETPHYAQWAAAVAPWMAERRKGVRYTPVFPEKREQWSTSEGQLR